MILESLNICSHNCGSYEFLGTVHSYLLSLPIPLLGFLFSPFLWISWRALWSLGITPLLVFFFFFLFGDKAKGVHQGCILLPCLFNLCAEYIMQNAGLDEDKLVSRLPGEISITSDMHMTQSLRQKAKRN